MRTAGAGRHTPAVPWGQGASAPEAASSPVPPMDSPSSCVPSVTHRITLDDAADVPSQLALDLGGAGGQGAEVGLAADDLGFGPHER